MSARRGSGRFGATPVSTQALRFWYMSPRVPSIGSTIRQNFALSRVRPNGNTVRAAGEPFRDEHDPTECVRLGAQHLEQYGFAHLVDGVNRVATLVTDDAAELVLRLAVRAKRVQHLLADPPVEPLHDGQGPSAPSRRPPSAPRARPFLPRSILTKDVARLARALPACRALSPAVP